MLKSISANTFEITKLKAERCHVRLFSSLIFFLIPPPTQKHRVISFIYPTKWKIHIAKKLCHSQKVHLQWKWIDTLLICLCCGFINAQGGHHSTKHHNCCNVKIFAINMLNLVMVVKKGASWYKLISRALSKIWPNLESKVKHI